MATFNYPSSQRTAQRLIEKFGAKGIIRRKTKNGDAWNPTLTTVDYHVSMARLNYAQSNIDGTLVKTGDLQFYIQAIGLDISPTTTDYIIFAGEIGTIVDVVTMSPSGTNIYYKIQARGFAKMAEEAANNYVPLTRKVIAGNGLTGGGVLNKDITISLSQTSLDALAAAQNGGGGQGGKGDDGLSAYQIAVNNGFVGSQEQWLASLKGDKGDQGDQGIQGATGPSGKDGKDGVDGINGKDGEDGKSTYQIAVDNGYQGTESEWLDSLKENGGVTESQLLELGLGKKFIYSATNVSEVIIPLNEIGNARRITIDFYDISTPSGYFTTFGFLSNTDDKTFITSDIYSYSGFLVNGPNALSVLFAPKSAKALFSGNMTEASCVKLDITLNSNSVVIESKALGAKTSKNVTTPVYYFVNSSLNITDPKFLKFSLASADTNFSCQYVKKEYT